MYEYKYFQAPADAGRRSKTGLDTKGDLTTREIDLMAGNGWEFVGLEDRPLLSRGWFGRMRQGTQCFMVFRRNRDPRSHVAALACPEHVRQTVIVEDADAVRPRRVRVLNAGDGFRPRRPVQRLLIAHAAE